jgi:rhodanese-related sulfurtransferase
MLRISRIAIPAVIVFLFVTPLTAQHVGWFAIKQLIRSKYPEVHQLSVDSLSAALSDTTSLPLLLFDVRTDSEYAVSHLKGAIRLDPHRDPMQSLESVSPDAPIVVYCSVGWRSSEMAARLAELGFTRVANLEGSIFEWANTGRPVYRDTLEVQEVHPFDDTWGVLLSAELRSYTASN